MRTLSPIATISAGILYDLEDDPLANDRAVPLSRYSHGQPAVDGDDLAGDIIVLHQEDDRLRHLFRLPDAVEQDSVLHGMLQELRRGSGVGVPFGDPWRHAVHAHVVVT